MTIAEREVRRYCKKKGLPVPQRKQIQKTKKRNAAKKKIQIILLMLITMLTMIILIETKPTAISFQNIFG